MVGSRGGAVALVGFVLLAGCHRHVSLSAPGPDAPEFERVAAYERLRAAARVDETTVRTQGIYTSVSHQTGKFIVLGDGQRVYHPEDLRPVVAATSPTAMAIDEVESARSKGLRWTTGGVVIGVGGMLVGAAMRPSAGADDHDRKFDRATNVMLGSLVAGTLLTLVGVLYYHRARDAQTSAFMTYDASLRDHLRLCVSGLGLVSCE